MDKYKEYLSLEDVKRAVLAKLGDALNNVDSLEVRSSVLRIHNDEGKPLSNEDMGRLNVQDRTYFFRLKELRRRTPFVGKHLEDFRNNPINKPKPVATHNKIYALAKAFFVADCARLFMDYYDVEEEPKTSNDCAMVSLLKKLTEAGARHAYECAEEYKIRGKELGSNTEAWENIVERYMDSGGERVVKLTYKTRSDDSLDGRLEPILRTVRYKRKRELGRSLLSRQSYKQSYLNIATLAEAFKSISAGGYFIEGVFPDVEEMIRNKRPDVYEKRPSEIPPPDENGGNGKK